MVSVRDIAYRFGDPDRRRDDPETVHARSLAESVRPGESVLCKRTPALVARCDGSCRAKVTWKIKNPGTPCSTSRLMNGCSDDRSAAVGKFDARPLALHVGRRDEKQFTFQIPPRFASLGSINVPSVKNGKEFCRSTGSRAIAGRQPPLENPCQVQVPRIIRIRKTDR